MSIESHVSRTRHRLLALTIIMLAPMASVGCGGDVAASDAVPTVQKTVLSRTYDIDQKYRSMMGPSSRESLLLGDDDIAPDELLWITGYRAVMVGRDGETPERQEFMCHSNLDIDPMAHRQAFDTTATFSSRLFTLSQGQQEIAFPPGFGIPIRAEESLSLTTQVLNLNHENEQFGVRHKVTIDFVRDQELESPMVPLFPTSAYGLQLISGEDGYYGLSRPDPEKHGPGCLVGEAASSHSYDDGHGRAFTGHWVVPPGREVNRTLVTKLMRVPYDTTIHYVAVHLHPFAESLTLVDLTSGETLFASKAENFDDRIGLARVDALSSAEGIPVYADHDYELVSVYNNTSAEPQDSMAVMYLYLRDLEVEEKLTARRDG